MSLSKVNNFSKEHTARYVCTLNFDTPIAEKIYMFFNSIVGEDLEVLEYPCFHGKFVTLFNHYVGLDRVKRWQAIDHRFTLIDKIRFKNENVKFQHRNILVDKTFKKHNVDVLISVGYLDNVVNPVEHLKQLFEKVEAKNVFITLPIDVEGKGQELKEENLRIVELFYPAGRYIQNRYSEMAIAEIAEAVGLEYLVCRTGSYNEAILYKLDVVDYGRGKKKLKKKEVEAKEEVKEKPKKKPSSKKKVSKKKKDNN